MHSLADNDTEPTIVAALTIVAVDRAARLIADTIVTLEAGGNLEDAIADLRTAHQLVRGGT